MKKIIVILLFVLFITGCGSSNKFIGTWYHYDGDNMVILSFTDDNNCSLEEFDEVEKCTYKYNDKKVFLSSVHDDLELNYNFIDNYLLIENTRFYKDMKTAKENVDKKVQKKEVVGSRTNKTRVPDVSGMNIDEAKTLLKTEGFALNIIYEENIIYKKDVVINTIPEKGEIVDKNQVIDVYVSSGYNR
jgi:hypothetical protein